MRYPACIRKPMPRHDTQHSLPTARCDCDCHRHHFYNPLNPGDLSLAGCACPDRLPPDLSDLRPVPPGQLLISARMTAFSHQQETGTPITPGELAARMDIPPALAESILDHLDGDTPPPVTTPTAPP